MNNKRLTYALLATVLIVWGIIGYRLIGVGGEEQSTALPSLQRSDAAVKQTAKDTFALIGGYKDPFLRKATVVQKKGTDKAIRKRKPEKTAATIKRVAESKWPSVQFLGMIKNRNTHKTLALMRIENTEHLLSVGDEAAGVAVVGIHSDSVLVSHGVDMKYVSKEN